MTFYDSDFQSCKGTLIHIESRPAEAKNEEAASDAGDATLQVTLQVMLEVSIGRANLLALVKSLKQSPSVSQLRLAGPGAATGATVATVAAAAQGK